MRAVLEAIESLTPEVRTFHFRPDKPLRYVAGQFTEIRLPHPDTDDRGARRWFTISSSPTEELVSVTTKFNPSPSSFKTALSNLRPGDEVSLAEPMGDFVLPKDRSLPLLFIVAGIGITPVRSIMKWLIDSGQQRDIHIIQGASSAADLLFNQLFTDYGAKLDRVLTNPPSGWPEQTGRLSAGLIRRLAGDPNDRLVYLSGPERLVEGLGRDLTAGGLTNSRLITDFFPGYDII